MIKSIGELNKRVEILRISSDINERGYPQEKRTVIAKCWAAVKDASYKTSEHFAAATGRTTEVTDFILREFVSRKYGIRAGMYVRYHGRMYRIVGKPYEGDHGRDFVTLHAQIECEASG